MFGYDIIIAKDTHNTIIASIGNFFGSPSRLQLLEKSTCRIIHLQNRLRFCYSVKVFNCKKSLHDRNRKQWNWIFWGNLLPIQLSDHFVKELLFMNAQSDQVGFVQLYKFTHAFRQVIRGGIKL